jgi:hypothetical protein
MPGKRVQFDDCTWHELGLLARDRMMDFQELADEAFSDLLKKHGRPTEQDDDVIKERGRICKDAISCSKEPDPIKIFVSNEIAGKYELPDISSERWSRVRRMARSLVK